MTKMKKQTEESKEKVKIVTIIRKRYLCCCCTFGFILGASAVILIIYALIRRLAYVHGFFIGFFLAIALCVCAYFFLLPIIKPLLEDSQNTKSKCPDEWLYYGGYCYFFSSDRLTWSLALKNCTNNSAYIADVADESAANWLRTMTDKHVGNDVWLGGRGVNETNFRWITDKITNLNFTYWADNQPTVEKRLITSKRNCILMVKDKSYKWTNEICNKDNSFICKRRQTFT